MTHLAPVPGTDWQVWRWALLRSAGFPIDGLDDLAAPECAATADEYLAGRADAAAFDRAFDAAVRAVAKALHDVAAQPAFRSAMLWQNPDAAATIAGVLRDGPDAARNERRRRREELIARYWQRYCGKNDSIGFFGPMCWVRFEPDAPFVQGGPGPALTRRQAVHCEWWALAALAATLADDPRIRPWFPLGRPAHVDLVGLRLHRPGTEPAPVSVSEAALLARSDGARPAVEVATGLIGEPGLGFRQVDDVYALAERLVERGLLEWGLDLPFNLDAEATMRAALAGIGDPAVRSAAAATLDRLTTRRDEVAAAAGPDELSTALSELDSEFAALTHTSARRRAGQTYAGRTLCHLDAVRDLDLTFGDAILARLTPLEPLLQSARWLTAELARAYTDVLSGLYRELAGETGTGPVPLADLWFLAQAALFGATRPADAVVDEYVRRWTALLGLDSVATGTRRLALSAAELRAAAATCSRRLGRGGRRPASTARICTCAHRTPRPWPGGSSLWCWASCTSPSPRWIRISSRSAIRTRPSWSPRWPTTFRPRGSTSACRPRCPAPAPATPTGFSAPTMRCWGSRRLSAWTGGG